MGITLKQIADIAGVHKSTVDKVVHNRPGVSDEKRKMIWELLDEYGYESNPLAKALNYQKKKMKVAVVMPEVDSTPYLKKGMELVAQDFNSFNIEVCYYILPLREEDAIGHCLQSLAEEAISGVVLFPVAMQGVADAMRKLSAQQIPVITVDSDLNHEPRMCFVGQDMFQAGRVAARMLSILSPTGGKLGIISNHHIQSVIQREQGFLEYLPKVADDIQLQEIITIKENPESAYRNTKELLGRHPEMNTLLITCGEVEDICRAVRDEKRMEDMTIVCYENYPEIEELIRQGEVACTISGDLREQGRLAMRILFEHLIYNIEPERDEIQIQNHIILKENII